MKKRTYKSTNSTTLSVSAHDPEAFDTTGFEPMKYTVVGKLTKKNKAKVLAANNSDSQT